MFWFLCVIAFCELYVRISHADAAYISNDGTEDAGCGLVSAPCRSLAQAALLNTTDILVVGSSYNNEHTVSLSGRNISHDGSSVPSFNILAENTSTATYYFILNGTSTFTSLAFKLAHDFSNQQALIHSTEVLQIINCSFAGYSTPGEGHINYDILCIHMGSAVLNGTSFANLAIHARYLVGVMSTMAVISINQLTVSNVTLVNGSRIVDVMDNMDNMSMPMVAGSLSIVGAQVTGIVAAHTNAVFLHVHANFAMMEMALQSSSSASSSFSSSFTNQMDPSQYQLTVRDTVVTNVSLHVDPPAPGPANTTTTTTGNSNRAIVGDEHGDLTPIVVCLMQMDGGDMMRRRRTGAGAETDTAGTQTQTQTRTRAKNADASVLFTNVSITQVFYFVSLAPVHSAASSSASSSSSHSRSHSLANSYTSFPALPWHFAVFCAITVGEGNWMYMAHIQLTNTTIGRAIYVSPNAEIAPANLFAAAALHAAGIEVMLMLADDVLLVVDNPDFVTGAGYPSYSQNVLCTAGAQLEFTKFNGKAYNATEPVSLWIDGFGPNCAVKSPFTAIPSLLVVPVFEWATLVSDATTGLPSAVVFEGQSLIPVNVTFELVEISSGAIVCVYPIAALAPTAIPKDADAGMQELLLNISENLYVAYVPPEVGGAIRNSVNEWRARVWYGAVKSGQQPAEPDHPFQLAGSILVRSPAVPPGPKPAPPKTQFTKTGGFAVLMIFVVIVVILVILTIACIVYRVVRKGAKTRYVNLGQEM